MGWKCLHEFHELARMKIILMNSRLAREIEIRAAHEIMAARAAQLAFLIDQLVPALRTKPPVLAGNIFVRRRGTRFI
jgi:hypothetical protein